MSFEFKKVDSLAFAKGENFEFHRVDDKCKFTFFGKVVSRRQIRGAIKAIDKACK